VVTGPQDLSTVHAKHKAKTAALKLARLQRIGFAPGGGGMLGAPGEQHNASAWFFKAISGVFTRLLLGSHPYAETSNHHFSLWAQHRAAVKTRVFGFSPEPC
jgi:hypothetical protein